MDEGCKQFVESVVVSSMMGAALALANIPEGDREAFIDRWADDATKLAFCLHSRIHARIEDYEAGEAKPPPRPAQPPAPPLEPRRESRWPTSEFYTFDEALAALNIDERRLKRLVSEGEIRAWRDGDHMKFKKSEIDSLSGRSPVRE